MGVEHCARVNREGEDDMSKKPTEMDKIIQYLKKVEEAKSEAVDLLRDDRAHEHHEHIVNALTDMVISKAFLSSKLTLLAGRK